MYTRKAVILVNDGVCERKKKRADLDKKEEKRVKKD